MILGKIIGKTSTNSFKFEIKGDAKKFEYLQIMHKADGYILAQVLEIEQTAESSIASCAVIGYRDANKVLRGLRSPFEPGTDVLKAEDDFVTKTLGLEENRNGAYVGVLDGRENIRVYIDLNKMLTKHVFITGKSGSGKSYTVSVLIEEIMENKVPLVILDPHGEYHTLSEPNIKDKDRLAKFGLKPKGFLDKIQEFSPDTEANTNARPIKLNDKHLKAAELMQLLPAKLSSAQMAALYSAIKNLGGDATFDDLFLELQILEESSAKWTLINLLEYIKKMNLFSDAPTLPSELVQANKCSIINLRGVPPEIQEVIVYKIVSDLFSERKKGNIPPFFLIVEEAQNFCPERGFGEAKSSAILRQVGAEGRKFGMGMCIVSQRPSRLDKSVISQVSTQIIMKVTNPNDVRAIAGSVEGMTSELENEMPNIPVGTGLVTGIVDLPLFVNVRPRKTKHGGEAVNIFSSMAEETGASDEKKDEGGKGELMLVIEPKISAKDIAMMSEKPVKVKAQLVPCILLKCSQGKEEFSLLVDLANGQVITNIEKGTGFNLASIRIEDLSPQQSKIFHVAMKMGSFKPAELFAKSGVQFSDLYDLITVLVKKGYLEQEGDKFMISGQLEELSKLQKFACYEKGEYKKIKAAEAMQKKFTVDSAKAFFARFAEIKSIKECWLLRNILV